MIVLEDYYSLRIFIGEKDTYEDSILYRWLVNQAQINGLAGASVVRTFMGFGAHHSIHQPGLLPYSPDSEIILEFVDKKPKIDGFLKIVGSAIQEGLVTVSKLEACQCRANKSG